MRLYTIFFLFFCFMFNLYGEYRVIGVFGSENCPWSKELKEEVWNSSIFQAHLTGIQLQEESRVEEETPILILQAETGEEIGHLGFLMIPPEKYALLFKEMISIHEMCRSLNELTSSQLLLFYRKCQVLNMEKCQEQILKRGLEIDQGIDFLLESYAKAVKAHPRKAQKIKKEIRARAPNKASVEWQLALLVFQAKNDRGEAPEIAAEPLEKYLRRYGHQDVDNEWRCHLILAQFFREKNILDKANEHHSEAMRLAPSDMKELLLHD